MSRPDPSLRSTDQNVPMSTPFTYHTPRRNPDKSTATENGVPATAPSGRLGVLKVVRNHVSGCDVPSAGGGPHGRVADCAEFGEAALCPTSPLRCVQGPSSVPPSGKEAPLMPVLCLPAPDGKKLL